MVNHTFVLSQGIPLLEEDAQKNCAINGTCRLVRKKFPELKKWCSDSLWVPSCFHGSVGTGWKVVEKYIIHDNINSCACLGKPVFPSCAPTWDGVYSNQTDYETHGRVASVRNALKMPRT